MLQVLCCSRRASSRLSPVPSLITVLPRASCMPWTAAACTDPGGAGSWAGEAAIPLHPVSQANAPVQTTLNCSDKAGEPGEISSHI